MSPDLAFILMLALRMAVAAAFVVTASFIAERSGPVIGALVATLPISAGPSYAFLALDHNAAFIAEGALASLPINAATIFLGLIYVVLAQRCNAAVSAGGAVAVLLYYVVGCTIFAVYIWSGRAVLKPSRLPPRLTWAPMREILRVGAISSIVSLSTNVSIGVATGLAGVVGPAAVAGYGTGARLEYLLVPLVFGLGAPVAAMVGTCIGAGNRERAMRVAWTGAAIAGGITEAIGLAAALFPHAWLTLFGSDRAMLETGTLYLRIVGPAYGFFGGGLALYFASQGAGRMGWPMAAAVLRVVIAAGGGWLAVAWFGGSTALFVVIAAALVTYGLANVAAVTGGVWFKERKPAAKAAAVTA